MDLKSFGINGKVVLIDDNWEEIKPLYEVLNKKGISCFYLNGQTYDIKDCSNNIRIIFLDMNLWPDSGQGSQSHQGARRLVEILSQIIKKENGPYAIAIWSKNEEEMLGDFKNKLFEENNLLKPLSIFSLSKSDYITTEMIDNSIDDNFENTKEEIFEIIKTSLRTHSIESAEIDEIIEEINPEIKKLEEYFKKREYQLSEKNFIKLEKDLYEKIKNNTVFYAFLLWEKILKDSNEKLLGELYSLLSNKNTESEIKNGLKEFFEIMAKTYMGKVMNNEKCFYYTYQLLFYLLEDYVLKDLNMFQNEVCSLALNIEKQHKKRCIDNEQNLKAKLNSKLHLDFENIDKIYPGDVYQLPEDYPYLEKIKTSILNQNEVEKTCSVYIKEQNIPKNDKAKTREEIESKIIEKYIACEISPNCDFAQEKKIFHKFILGVIVDAKNKDFLNSHAENFYLSPLLGIDDKEKILAFSFRTLKTTSISEENQYLEKEAFLFRIRKELLSEIQTKVSNHMGRLGIISF